MNAALKVPDRYVDLTVGVLIGLGIGLLITIIAAWR